MPTVSTTAADARAEDLRTTFDAAFDTELSCRDRIVTGDTCVCVTL